MTQQDKEILLKDLCARLPYDVMCQTDEHRKIHKLKGVNKHKGIWWYEFDGFRNIKLPKPYLRPLSSMTEEEKDELHDWGWEYTGNDIITGGSTDADNFYKRYEKNLYDLKWLADWLNAHHFDYRGLIERGLALEAPEGMYKIKEK